MRYDRQATGRIIKKLRQRQGQTQEVLSGLADISRSHLAMIENGTKNANVDTLWRIAEAFNMPLSEFFRLVEEDISQSK